MSCQIVIQLARFGDLVQTARLVQSLQNEGETHICVDRSLTPLASLLYPHCFIHGIIAHADTQKLDSSLFTEILSYNRKLFAELAELDAHVYNLNHSPLNFALASLFPVEKVHGYSVKNGQVFRDKWLQFAFRWIAERRLSPMNLVDIWGYLAKHPIPPQEVTPLAKSGGKGIGVVLAGQQARRSLPPDVLSPIIASLFEGLGGVPIFLIGSKAERAIGHKLMSYLPRQLITYTNNLAGRTNWVDLVDLLQNLDILVSPDTGTMHLGAKLGVPIFGIFLSSAWAWETGPYGLGHHIWQSISDCAPCLESAKCLNEVACLAAFRNPAFLRTLCLEVKTFQDNGNYQHDLSGLICMHSAFDNLGLIWQYENAPLDREKSRRMALRHLFAEYLASQGQIDYLPERDSQIFAQTFFHEADWMLPDSSTL